jgi:hypothetical protein
MVPEMPENTLLNLKRTWDVSEIVTMPGSIAHMLIFEDVLSQIESEGGFEDLVNMLRANINFGRLGSIGPDLPYYQGVKKTAINFAILKTGKPAPIETWSDQLHSKSPNIFPLKMIEIAWRETLLEAPEWDEIARKQWAFIFGFLTHIAADQTIHPYVNKIAGQYYREKENRQKHMSCEAYQDVVLFNNRFQKDIFTEDLKKWVNISTEPSDMQQYFRGFLEKSFIEAHAIHPSEKDIENWFRGLSFIYSIMKYYGPYKTANTDFQTNKENSAMYKEFLFSVGPTGGTYQDYYTSAVALALIYVKAAYRLFDINHADFKDEQRRQFLEIIINADLVNPLDNNILFDATTAYRKYFGNK